MSLLGRMYRNETSVPFAKLWKPVGFCSLLVLIISVSGLGFRGLNLGLEFEGGGAWEVQLLELKRNRCEMHCAH